MYEILFPLATILNAIYSSKAIVEFIHAASIDFITFKMKMRLINKCRINSEISLPLQRQRFGNNMNKDVCAHMNVCCMAFVCCFSKISNATQVSNKNI